MKNYIKTLMVISFFVVSGQLFGQFLGLRIGTNFSNQLIKDNTINYSNEAKFKMLPGGSLGVVLDFPVYKGASVETGLLLNTKGYKLKESDANSKSVTYNYLAYIDLPVNIKYTFDLGGPKVFVLAGPYFAYGVFGKGYTKETVGTIENTYEFEYNWGSGATDDYKPFDIGLNFGGGVQLGAFVIGANYGLGLRNISPVNDNGFLIKNRVLNIYIGANLSF
jgi:hypothetical protein